MRTQIAKYLDPLMDRDEFDIVGDFSAPFPVEIICAILGVPEADWQMIRHQTDAMLHREEGQGTVSEAQAEAAAAAHDLVRLPHVGVPDRREHLLAHRVAA